jgi:hypothetical protein
VDEPTLIPEIVSIMSDFRVRKPGVDMYTLMRSQKILMSDVGIGGRGQCMDFIYFGECGKVGCTYSHVAGAVSTGKRRDIIKKWRKQSPGTSRRKSARVADGKGKARRKE